jgi:integrase
MFVSFYLDKPQNKSSMIYISVVLKTNRIRKSTGLKVISKFWNQDAQKVKNHDAKDNLPPIELNNALSQIKTKILKNYAVLRSGDSFSFSDIRKMVDKVLNGLDSTYLAILFQNYLNEKIKHNNSSKSTITRYEIVKKHILGFEQYHSRRITADEVNYDFAMEFFNYLNMIKISNSSVKNYFKFIKSVMNWALEAKLHTNNHFSKEISRAVKSFNTNNSHRVALTEEEYRKIEKIELDDYLAKVRDLFLLQTNACVRFSELANLKLDGDKLKTISNKNKKTIERPITKSLEELLSRKPLSEVIIKIDLNKYNEGIKEICKKCGIDTLIQTEKNIGSKLKLEEKPKYELISSHSARHTFVSILLQKGATPNEVMEITGHSSYDVLKHYIDLDKEKIYEKTSKLL